MCIRDSRDPALRGTKHRVATDRQVLVTRGRRDGRTIIIVPEVKDNTAIGLTLLHARFSDTVDAPVARGVITGYQNRFSALKDAVLETEPVFRDDLLGELAITDLLVLPISELADHWRSSTS